jgi:8-hydroxy-5-deazaflavin:NADPH oxidoreductase
VLVARSRSRRAAIARLTLDAGHSVAIATLGNTGHLALVTQLLIPGAEPLWAVDAIARADIVVLAMPLHRFRCVHAGVLRNTPPASDLPAVTD